MTLKTGSGQGAKSYFKRWVAGMAFAATSNLVGTFAIASVLHEDPRYLVENSGMFRESVRYAVTRVFICCRDDGTTGTNWAGILGPLATAGVANSYLAKDSQGVGNVFENLGLRARHLGGNEHYARVLAACEPEAGPTSRGS